MIPKAGNSRFSEFCSFFFFEPIEARDHQVAGRGFAPHGVFSNSTLMNEMQDERLFFIQCLEIVLMPHMKTSSPLT